jgi:hypothetical protein
VVAVLDTLANEAADHLDLLRSLERRWKAARARIPAQWSTPRAALTVDVMAARPNLSNE